MTSDLGEIFCNINNSNSSYQKWKIHLTTDPENYIVINVGNDLVLFCSKAYKIFMTEIDKKLYEKLEMPFVFSMFLKKNDKK